MKSWLKKRLAFGLVLSLFVLMLAACEAGGGKEGSSNTSGNAAANAGANAGAGAPAEEISLADLEKKAKEEGSVVSVGMPDSWANWKDTWADLLTKYSLQHTDTDMSSADEINKFEAEKDKPTADIGDVGIAFGPVAVDKGVTQPYKTSYWDEIPDWAKDKDGHWVVGYTGSIAIFTNTDLVKQAPQSWEDLKNGDYKIIVGDVTKAAQAQMAVLAAAMAYGGDETNIEPGIAYFEDLAKKGRLSNAEASLANIEKGEVQVTLFWDFNALNYRDQLGGVDKFNVAIPKEGSVVSGYATIINKYAPHPNAAKLAREYILSDEGQINLAKGYARPIRESVQLPEDVAAKLLPAEAYANVKPVSDYKAWEETAKQLPQLWQERVLVHMN
ncbi:ABC transporter substrate-binding protein [Paenibacillus macerans]|uniref:Extracellular solute-binding protein n=1 Tax=Paenibacillus macerans TaxID=44252 RepID=A0A6N8EUJ8_PAEMA|nr:ABC transporter substrate-binding protein [Paenibacillus macerans]MBS5910332.1 extracellular solute-binding protein [Paenibacillus macerans]MEC0135688.1 ABC transporter substrate-binding protein [Paenibacillus macerans]MUG22420.1 extracellular solute-binding protein [Paenibacillus macerans]UMV49183.1 ABC transporter substrate-binding protein [Paenibacillus macerans]GBK65282.1 ABC transporter substrate-binding protein [Paenibacillus macerans]